MNRRQLLRAILASPGFALVPIAPQRSLLSLNFDGVRRMGISEWRNTAATISVWPDKSGNGNHMTGVAFLTCCQDNSDATGGVRRRWENGVLVHEEYYGDWKPPAPVKLAVDVAGSTVRFTVSGVAERTPLLLRRKT